MLTSKTIQMRLVEEKDAEFILSLRLRDDLNRYLSKVDSDVVADKMCDKNSKPVTHASCNTQDCSCSKKETYWGTCNKDVCVSVPSGLKCNKKKWSICYSWSTTYTKVCAPVPTPCKKEKTVEYKAQTCE